MLAALIIVFREVFETGLVVGIVMAVTRGISGRGWWIGGGIFTGALGACVAAAFAGAIGAAFQGIGQELFNAAILSLAVLMLTWHNVWMARHGRELAAEMRAVGEAVVSGSKSLLGLAIVVAVAVLREGFEVVLFLYGVVAAEGGFNVGILLGAFVGLVLGAGVCMLTYYGLLKIPARHLFAVTTVMIAFLAAGMAAQATAFIQQSGLVTALGRTVWDTSWLLTDDSILGKAMHTLIGYTAQPSELELVVYLATLTVMAVAMKLMGHSPAPIPAPAHPRA